MFFLKKLHITELLDLKKKSPVKSHILEFTNFNSFIYELQVTLPHIIHASTISYIW